MAVSLSLASLFVLAVLSVLRLPDVPGIAPIIELIVRIVEPEAVEPEVVEPEVVEPEVVEPPPQTKDPAEVADLPQPTVHSEGDTQEFAPDQDTAPASAAADTPIIDTARVPVDWDRAKDQAAEAFLDELHNPPSVNPVLEEKRRRLTGQYQPRTTPGPRRIWENVERDQLGRSVLRDGNCFKVLDDPNVGSREEFETFGQFIAKCTYQKRRPKELPWVDGIRQRYPYLKDPDGYLKGVDGPGDVGDEDTQE